MVVDELMSESRHWLEVLHLVPVVFASVLILVYTRPGDGGIENTTTWVNIVD